MGMAKKGKKNVTVLIDEKVWETSRKVLSKLGMSRSSFIQIILEGVIETEGNSIKNVWKDTSNKIIDKVKLKL
jgi:antitoxin component of RelBE/YafQ-DinJ toxin-antitoxin module